MSDFKTTPIKNSYELMIDRLKAVISDKDAELARLKAEVERLKGELDDTHYAWNQDVRRHRERLKEEEADLAAANKVIEGVREWMLESQFCSAPYCKKCVVKLEQLLEDK